MKGLRNKLIVCVILALFVALAFTGCGDKNKNDEDNYFEATATAVAFRSDGTYTTTLTVEGATFDGVSADDVTVEYYELDEAAYSAAVEAASGTENPEVNDEDYTTAVKVETQKAEVDGANMTLTFVDDKAGEKLTEFYGVTVSGKNIVAGVDVEFNEYTLRAETESVLASQNEHAVTLTLGDGEFASSASKDDIVLRGSFKEMTVDSLSAEGKNMTMQLVGKPVKDENSNAYLEGIIDVPAKDIVDAEREYSVRIPVQIEAAYFKSEELKASGAQYTLPLVLIDCGKDIADIQAEDIAFYDTQTNELAGIAVESVEKNGETLTLTLTIDDSNGTKNSAAEKINGTTVKIGDDFDFIANVSSVSFYPVFDYAEDSGDNIRITLELYAKNGVFGNNIGNALFAFDEDFAGAQVVSVERKSDSVVEAVIDVPANGMTAENLDMTGGVTLKEGALVNVWGENAAETSYTRSYSNDTMGRDLSGADIDVIKGIVGGFGNTTFGTLTSVASGAASGASAVLTILDLTGIMPNKTSQTLTLLKEVEEKIDNIHYILNKELGILKVMQKQLYTQDIAAFDSDLEELSTYNNEVTGYFRTGAEKLGVAQPAAENVTDVQNNQEEWKKYAKNLSMAIKEADKFGSPVEGFNSKFKELEALFVRVVTQVKKESNQNPMAVLDQMCSLTYNFDTIAYATRAAQRENIRYQLEKAFINIAMYYNCDMENDSVKEDGKALQAFEDLIREDSDPKKCGQFAVKKRTDGLTLCYIKGYTFFTGADYWEHDGLESAQRYAILLGKDPNKYDTFDKKDDFEEDERTDFVSRMNGRTIKEEIKLAGFGCYWYGLDGVAFYRKRKYNGERRHWYSSDKMWNQYVYAILWDNTEITWELQDSEGPGSFYMSFISWVGPKQ